MASQSLRIPFGTQRSVMPNASTLLDGFLHSSATVRSGHKRLDASDSTSTFPDPKLYLVARTDGVPSIFDIQEQRNIADHFPAVQDCIREFVYALMTTDLGLAVKPIGIYGIRDDITRFLSSNGSLGDEITHLLSPGDLYIVSPSDCLTSKVFYLFFWPRDTTWSDRATFSVRRERKTVLRFLTSVTNQVMAMFSTDHEEYIASKSGFELQCRPSSQMYTRFFSDGRRVDSPRDPAIRLIVGEKTHGFLTAKYVPSTTKVDGMRASPFTTTELRLLLESKCLRLSETLSEDALRILVEHGLDSRFTEECNHWVKQRKILPKKCEADVRRDEPFPEQDVCKEMVLLEDALREVVVTRLLRVFTTFTRESLGYSVEKRPQDCLSTLHPEMFDALQDLLNKENLRCIPLAAFQTWKRRLAITRILLQKYQDLGALRGDLIDAVFRDDLEGAQDVLTRSKSKDRMRPLRRIFPHNSTLERKIIPDAKRLASCTSDTGCLVDLEESVKREPLLQDARTGITAIVRSHFDAVANKFAKQLSARAKLFRVRDHDKRVQRLADDLTEVQNRALRLDLIRSVNEKSKSEGASITFLDSLKVIKDDEDYYQLAGRQETAFGPALEYGIHVMAIACKQRENLQSDPTFIPSPHVRDYLAHSFQLQIGNRILHSQLLAHNLLLLVIEHPGQTISVFLEAPSAMESAISSKRSKKVLRDNVGQGLILAFDETKRMLMVCATTKLYLNFFIFDREYGSLNIWENPVELAPLYNSQDITIHKACFVSGGEELILVDSSAMTRVYSLAAQKMRPPSLQLPQLPDAIFFSPDSSYFLALWTHDSESLLRAYYWRTFGSAEGIPIDLPTTPTGPLALTSFVNKSSVHLMGLDIHTQKCYSLALNVFKKVFHCGICLEDHSEDVQVCVDVCGHKFCRDSMREYIESQLSDRRFPVFCPICVAEKQSRSHTAITEAWVRKIGISDKQYDTWVELELLPFSVLIECRKCLRSAFIDRQQHDEFLIISCPFPGCFHRWCKACQQYVPFAGPPHSCDGTLELDILMKSEGWKRCPGCGVGIQKSAGCNHMTCKAPACNTHFCYLCGDLIASTNGEDMDTAVNAHFRLKKECTMFG